MKVARLPCDLLFETIENTRTRLEERLRVLGPASKGGAALTGAMAYSLLAGGKRLRPLLTVLLGGWGVH